MTREEAERIIADEGLAYCNLLEERADAADELVVRKDAGRWTVYATGERAGRIAGSEAVFGNEEDALENFVRRLRALNRVMRSGPWQGRR